MISNKLKLRILSQTLTDDNCGDEIGAHEDEVRLRTNAIHSNGPGLR
jgi:hypothetical protein